MESSAVTSIASSCWQLLASDESDKKKIQRYTDGVFVGYSFYPETDWKKYGYFPPDGHQVLGAWRHPRSLVFAFLLDNSLMQKGGEYSQYLIYAMGVETEIALIEKRISSLKKDLRKQAHKMAQTLGAASRLDQMTPNRSIGMFTAVLTFVTGLVNAFSYYLRTLPLPQFGSQSAQQVYIILLSTIHFLSLGLLITVTIICGLFLLKYAFILIRRL